jgi:hypothetical protein
MKSLGGWEDGRGGAEEREFLGAEIEEQRRGGSRKGRGGGKPLSFKTKANSK